MGRCFTIHLIRHLPTAGNKEKRYIGWTDEPILESTASFRDLTSTESLYGSDLLRARQTAAFYFPTAVYSEDSKWRECNFGEFEGKTYEDLEKKEAYRKWIDDPYRNAPTEGESLKDVESRVLLALLEVPNQAVIVTHGGPIRVILTKFSSEEKEFWSWDIPHGSGYRLEWESEKAFKEGKPCTSILVAHRTAKGSM